MQNEQIERFQERERESCVCVCEREREVFLLASIHQGKSDNKRKKRWKEQKHAKIKETLTNI